MHIKTYKDFHTLTCISVIKTCVTALVLKDKKTISHSCLQKVLSYFHKCVFSVKSRLIFNVSYYRHTTEKLVHTRINTYSNENEWIKRLSYFCLYVCNKDLRTDLVLKDKNAQI